MRIPGSGYDPHKTPDSILNNQPGSGFGVADPDEGDHNPDMIFEKRNKDPTLKNLPGSGFLFAVLELAVKSKNFCSL